MASILVPGRDLGGYRLEARLGRGGMGEVWSAHDVVLGRRVAIKVMLGAEGEDVRLRERFVREGRAAAALVHPSVVTVFATGETDGVAWLAMELVEGQTLRAVGRSAPLATKVAWLSALASGLDAVHRAGFVHRDVKPDNVMIARDGHLKLLDFGLVRPPPGAAPLTRTGYVMGTPRYMAPEQWRGETVDARADQFAWGLVAFELLSGRHPDDCSAGFGRLASWAAPARPIASLVPEVRPEVAQLVDRALAVRAADRFGSMQEIAEVLARVTTASIGPPLVPAAAMPTLADAPPRVAPSVVRPAPASTPRVLVFLGGFAAVLLASLVAVAVVLLVRSPPADAPLASAAVSTPPRVSPAPAPSPAGDAPAESAVASAPSSSAPPRRTVRASPARSAAPPLAPATSTPAAAVCAPFTTLEVSARDFEGTVPLPALAAWERAIRGPLTACYRGTAAPVCAGTRVTIGVRLHGGKRHESSGIGTSAYGDGELPPAQCLFAAVDHDVPQPTVATTFQQLRIELR